MKFWKIWILQVDPSFYRYMFVGLLTNLFGYGSYLIATFAGMGPKATMSFLYLLCFSLSFVFNRSYTFKESDSYLSITLIKFLISHFVAYTVNLLALMIFVDFYEVPHQFVQASCVILLALYLYAVSKYWVFR